MNAPTFKGTETESSQLLAAIQRHCTCEFDTETGVRLTTCPGHDMLVSADAQRILDHLLFVRRYLADRLQEAEFAVAA